MRAPRQPTDTSSLLSQRPTLHGLDPIFFPGSIVLIDALEQAGSVADSIWKNISATFSEGTISRIGASKGELAELTKNQTVKGDLAVIVAPPSLLMPLACACDGAGVRGALLMSADRNEPVRSDVLEPFTDISGLCANGMRIIGPQSFGLINPHHDLNITPGHPMPERGNIAFLSQSGALCSAVLDWSFRTNIGFSAMVSCDVMLDVDWSNLITYFGDDPHTKSIVVYLETIGDARSFLSAAREVALSKPIIALKAGRTTTGAAVAALHSHGDSTVDAVLNAALQRVGVLRVRSISEMFYMANILATQPLPRGPKLTVITNAIGPAVMATDSLLASGGSLAKLSSETTKAIQSLVQHSNCCDNPIDLLGDADAELYAAALHAVSRDKASDGTLVILTPQPRTQPTQTARLLVDSNTVNKKPLLGSWMGGDRVAEGQMVLFEAGIPAFPYPNTPARLFALMWRHAQNLKGIYETPTLIMDERSRPVDSESVALLLEGIREADRTDLTEWEAKAVLKAYGIPVVDTLPAATEDEALACAEIFGYPVIMKLISYNLALKHQVQGTRASLRNDDDVRIGFASIRDSVEAAGAAGEFLGVTVQKMIVTRGCELIAGSSLDAEFGPYMYFGTGGQMSDIINDKALGLPPLTSVLALRMMERTRVWKALSENPTPKREARLSQLQALLVRLSQLIINHPTIKSLCINPLLATEDSIVALDVRLTIHSAQVSKSDMPRTAIRPYPAQYTWHETAHNGMQVLVRPVMPEDEPLIVEFHKVLSEETIYKRYFFQHKLSRRTSHERLRRTCFLDFDRETALAALIEHPEDGPIVAGVGRLARDRIGESAEIALVVADPHQSQGIGTLILKHLVDIAKKEGLKRVEGTMLPDNIHMQHLFGKVGFSIGPGSDDTVVARLSII